jgi:hypothetical protein
MGKYRLLCLNPQSAIAPPPPSGLTNPRVPDLAGRSIGIIWCGKEGGENFLDAVSELLKHRFPSALILRFIWGLPGVAERIIKETDTFVYGVGDSGIGAWENTARTIALEKLGKPGVVVFCDHLMQNARASADAQGMPAVRMVTVPSLEYYPSRISVEKVKPVAEKTINAIIEALVRPLVPEEKTSKPKPKAASSERVEVTAGNYELAYEKFNQLFLENHWSDGLPLVPPTKEAVRAMLAGTACPPEEVIGTIPSPDGLATIGVANVQKIAVNAVLAGARPEYLPVVIAAIECLADRRFNLYHLQTSTACPVPLIWVNSPIAREVGMNSGMGYLGRGCRANSTTGRAVGLCLINIGWRLVEADAGFTGEPEGYCGFIFAENEAASPWESFAVEHGFQPQDSTVTVIENFYCNRYGPGGGMSSQTMEKSLEILAGLVSGTGASTKKTRFTFFKSKYGEIALYPTFARQLAAAGFTKKSLVRWLYDHTRVPWEGLGQSDQELIKAAAAASTVEGLKETDCRPGGTVPSFSDPKHIAVLVAGDAAGYTVVWGTPVGSTVNMEDDAASGPPFMTKLVRGATLTKAGR